jgi:hypothetical protein
MNSQELKRRLTIYASIQLLSIFIGVSGIALWSYAAYSKTAYLVNISFALVILSGLFNNWFYFRALDYTEIGEWRKYLNPSVTLTILITAVTVFIFYFGGFGIDVQSQRFLAILLSIFLTFALGFFSFSLPLVLHRNELDETDQSKTYDQIIYDVDKSIDILRESVFISENSITTQKQKIDDMAVTLQRIADSVQLMIGIYYRTFIEKKRRPVDFFKIASLVFGPTVSAIVSFLTK